MNGRMRDMQDMSEKMKRAFLVRDCSANWFEHVPGCLEEGTGRFFAKNPGWFVTDLEGVIDWCAAEKVGALAVEGFLSDRHDPYLSKAQGFDAARRVCGYAKKKGVALWLVTPRRADGAVYRELYDQPEKFDLLSPERVRRELPDLSGIAYENEPIDGAEILGVPTAAPDFLVEPIRAACAAAAAHGRKKLVLRVSPSPHRANAEFNYRAFVYFTDDPSRTLHDFVRDVMAPRLGGVRAAESYVTWADLVRSPQRIPAAVRELAQLTGTMTDPDVLGRWYSLADYLGAARFAAEQREEVRS